MSAKLVVPVERIELPTFGLQNRCSTAELNRRIEGICCPRTQGWIPSIFRRLEYQTCPQRARTSKPVSILSAHEKGGLPAAFPPHEACALLAKMAAAVFAAEIPAGRANKAVLPRIGVAGERRCGYGCCGADRAADDAGGDVARPEAAVLIAPAVVAVVPVAVMAVGAPLMIGAPVGIARTVILAIGVWIVLRAFAGIDDHLLRQSGAGQR
jgi:hypothetical protein